MLYTACGLSLSQEPRLLQNRSAICIPLVDQESLLVASTDAGERPRLLSAPSKRGPPHGCTMPSHTNLLGRAVVEVKDRLLW